MRSFLFLICVINSFFVIAQKPFEGTIVYNVSTPDNKTGELSVYFAPSKIKIRYKERREYDKSYLLINLDSGKLFSVDETTKTYKSKPLKETTETDTHSRKTIAGYPTISVKLGSSSTILNSVLSTNSIYHYSEALSFPVPEKYLANPELAMIYNGFIVLRAELTIADYVVGHTSSSDTATNNKLIFEAKTVIPQQLNNSEFTIAADYTKDRPAELKVDHSAINLDSISITAIDTTETSAATPIGTVGTQQPSPTKKETPLHKPHLKRKAIKRKKA